TWRVHSRKLKERLTGSHDWEEFDGTIRSFKLMEGLANVDDTEFDMPEGIYRGVAPRAYDPKTGLCHLVDRWPQSSRCSRPAGQGSLRPRRRHVLCRRHAARQADQGAVRLVADHAGVRALGAGLFG